MMVNLPWRWFINAWVGRSEGGFPRDSLHEAERQFLIYVSVPNQHKTPFSQVSCHKYKQLQFQMRPDSINFAANFRFGTDFPPFPTNYPQRVGQRELWRRVRSSDLMRWFLRLIVLLCVTRYLFEMWILICLFSCEMQLSFQESTKCSH